MVQFIRTIFLCTPVPIGSGTPSEYNRKLSFEGDVIIVFLCHGYIDWNTIARVFAVMVQICPWVQEQKQKV